MRGAVGRFTSRNLRAANRLRAPDGVHAVRGSASRGTTGARPDRGALATVRCRLHACRPGTETEGFGLGLLEVVDGKIEMNLLGVAPSGQVGDS